MLLQELLKVCNQEELGELYAFWNGDGNRAAREDDLPTALTYRMTNEILVRRRVRFLSPKLVDLLRFFLGRRQFEATFEAIRHSRTFSFMSPHEVEAAVRALVKRGFLFPRRRAADRPDRFVVAHELGDLLRGELKDLDLDLAESFSLRRLLAATHQPDGGHEAPARQVRRLTAPQAVAERVATLSSKVQDIYQRAVEQGAGLLSQAAFARGDAGESQRARREVKEALESASLGTVRHLSLGEYGINHFDDMVVVFAEVLQAELTDHPPAGDHLRPRALGVDLLSDLSHLLTRLSREKVRLTQSGTVYRTAARKIEEQLILAAKGNLDPEELFRFLLDLALSRHLIRKTGDRHLVLTSKGRTWPRLSVGFKLKELLQGVLDQEHQAFHRPRLQQLCLDYLPRLCGARWFDFSLVTGLIRHQYLACLDETEVREAYQSRYQYSSEAHMRDLPQLTQMIGAFLSRELHLLGLVDLLFDGERPVGLRLSALASKALELGEGEASPAAGTRLLVNPDFEILLFPEGDAYEIIQRLDRFSERVSSENAHRFNITARSIERAVAAGMNVAEILETLSENSDSELPQNVVYSIRDYAAKVRFVRVQRAVLLSARHKEVIDSMLRRSDVRKVVRERLSPRILALQPDANLDDLLPLLEEEGIFLDGTGEDRSAEPGEPADDDSH